MIKIALNNKVNTLRYILTPDNKLQPESETVDHSRLVTTSIHSINELGKQLLKAAADGNSQEIKSLLTKGSPFTSDWLGTSPLHLAAQNNNIEVCEVLLRAGISKDARNKVDRTPLHMAAYEGHLEIVESLVKHGADVNCIDMLNMTPLHWAVQNGHSSVVELLVRNGAQLDITNKFDLTPHDIAIQINKLDIIELLQGDSQTAAEHLVMQLEGECDDIVEIEREEDNASNELIMIPEDPVIINFDNKNELNQFTENGQRTSFSQAPIIIDLDNEAENTSQTTHKDNEIQSLTNTPSTTFKLINGVLTNMTDEETDNSFSALKLLQEHGITMIPNDSEETNILNTVMESGHSVVLTDVGKEVLNSVKQCEEEAPVGRKKVITVTPEEFLAMTNGNYLKNVNVLGKIKVLPGKPSARRVVMKKNRPSPFHHNNNTIMVKNNVNKPKTELEYVMGQLIEARKTIEEYKVKLRKKEVEVQRYKMQLKLLMDNS